jgi:hypothetical protein
MLNGNVQHSPAEGILSRSGAAAEVSDVTVAHVAPSACHALPQGRGAGVGRGRGVGVHLPVHGVAVAVGLAVGVGVGVSPCTYLAVA